MPLVRVHVKLKPELLDSAGRAVADSLRRMGHEGVTDARVGKLIELRMESFDEAEVRRMCDRLLANPVVEDFEFEVVD